MVGLAEEEGGTSLVDFAADVDEAEEDEDVLDAGLVETKESVDISTSTHTHVGIRIRAMMVESK